MGVLIALLITLSLPFYRDAHNVPPLRGNGWVRITPRPIDDNTIKLYNMELKVMTWEYAESDWSRKWGVLFADLNRDVKKIHGCLAK